MREFMLKPTVYQYDKAKEFAAQFQVGEGDLLITNRYIYEPYFGELNLKCDVVYQEEYGVGEPTDDMAEAMYQDLTRNGKRYKRIIAVGGGTVLDLAKIFVLKNVYPVNDLYDGKLEIKKDKELVLVPTTCGTGSEVTNISILALNQKGTKKGLALEEMYADSAVLIPELLEGLPFRFFAASSIDALVHAVESILSPKGNETTRLFGYRAISILLEGFQEIAAEGQQAVKALLGKFLLASNYAGIAFGNAGCAAVHALSYPLGAKYHVPHGESNYAMFTGVMKTYMEIRSDGEIQTLNRYMAGILKCDEAQVYEKLEELLNHLLLKKPLHEYGMTEDDLWEFTDSVLVNQTRLLANNFVPLDRECIFNIYKELF